jgi:hypothetical protein
MLFKIFILIYILQIILTIHNFYNTCKNKNLYSWFLYITHHIFDVFLFWSFLFLKTKSDYLFHFIFAIIIIIHWLTYNNKCIVTVLMNRECCYPDEQPLDSIKNMVGLSYLNEYTNEYFHYVWIVILLAQDIYMILAN